MRHFSGFCHWILTILGAALLTLSPKALAQTSALAAFPLTTLEHPDDPYSIQYQFTEGSKKFAGQIIETDRFRHPVVIKETKEHIEFANYLHDGKYWIARLNKSAQVDRTYFHVVRFAAVPGVTAAHTQYRVIFKPGSEVELRSQTGGSEVEKVNDVVISYEASRPAGIPYSFVEGIRDNYAIVARALSGQQRVSESLENSTEQYELNLQSHESMELLLSSIIKGDQDRFSRFYNTLLPNCTTEVFTRLDELSTRKHLKFEKFLTVLSNDPIAGPSLRDLKVRGLLGARGPNLKAEFLEGQTTYVPTKKDQEQRLGIFPEELAEQYSLVFHTPGGAELSKREKQVIAQAQKELYQLIAQVLQSSLSTVALDQMDGQALFQEGLLKVHTTIKEFVSRLDQSIPAGFESNLAFYFAPFVGSEQDEITEQIVQGLPARLPFKTYKAVDLYQIRQAPGKVRSAFEEEAQRKGLTPPAFHMSAAVVQLHLERGVSKAEVQIVGGLNHIERPLGIEQGPVRLASLQANPSMVLIGLKHQVGETTPPQVHVEFGEDLTPRSERPQGNWGVNMIIDQRSQRYGLFKVDEGTHRPSYSRLDAVPYFLGEEKYLGIDLKFPILSMDVDLQSLSLSRINLKVYKPFLGLTISSNSIDEQFKAGINNQIEELKGNLLQTVFKAQDCNSNLVQ